MTHLYLSVTSGYKTLLNSPIISLSVGLHFLISLWYTIFLSILSKTVFFMQTRRLSNSRLMCELQTHLSLIGPGVWEREILILYLKVLQMSKGLGGDVKMHQWSYFSVFIQWYHNSWLDLWYFPLTMGVTEHISIVSWFSFDFWFLFRVCFLSKHSQLKEQH